MEITKQNLLDRMSDYKSGTIPPQVSFTTAAIDIQSQWTYWLVLGHDKQGGTYWIDWGAIEVVLYELQGKVNPTTAMFATAVKAVASKIVPFKPRHLVDDSTVNMPQAKAALAAKILSGTVSFPADLTEQNRKYLIRHLTKGEKGQGRSDLFDCSAAAYAASLSLTTGERQ